MEKEKKNLVFNTFLFLSSFFFIFLLIEIYVRTVVDNGSNLDLEMLKYAKTMKIVSKNKDIGLEHRKNVEKM